MWEKCRCILSLQNSSLWRHSGWKRTDKKIVLGLISSIPSLPFSPGVLLLQASGFFRIEQETVIRQQNLGDDFTSHACNTFRSQVTTHNVILSVFLRGHNVGSQLRKERRNGIPAKRSASSLNYRRIKGGLACSAGKLNDTSCLRWVLALESKSKPSLL